jgi:hypothetical protein
MRKEDLIEFSELMSFLGYTDERSTKSWCKKNKIPLVKVGSKKYIPSHLLTQYIDNQLVTFAQANHLNPNHVLGIKEIKTAQVKEAKEIRMEIKNSKSEVTQRFLKNIKAA